MAVVMPLHRHDLLRLMLERIKPVQIAQENLHRCDQRRHPHRHRTHLARVQIRTVLEQVPSADSTDHESNGEVRRRDSVPQTRSEEHTSELQSLMRISYAVFCFKK